MLLITLFVFYPVNSVRRQTRNTTEDSCYWEANSCSIRQKTPPPFINPDGYETLNFSQLGPVDEDTKIFRNVGKYLPNDTE